MDDESETAGKDGKLQKIRYYAGSAVIAALYALTFAVAVEYFLRFFHVI